MWRLPLLLAGILLTLAPSQSGFQPYPGAESSAPWFQKYAADTSTEMRKINPRATLQMWMTSDPYEKVVAFYRTRGREQGDFARSLIANLSANSMRNVQATHLIFDAADSPVTSSNYVSIQRPLIVSFDPLVVHDVTQIGWYTVKK